MDLEALEKMQNTTQSVTGNSPTECHVLLFQTLSLGTQTLILAFVASPGLSGIFPNNCITIKSTGEDWVVDMKLEIHQS